jgi:hypothetical protein
MRSINTIPGRKTCSYAECIVLLHAKSLDDAAMPSTLVMATVVAAIYGRETLAVFEDLKRGMVP